MAEQRCAECGGVGDKDGRRCANCSGRGWTYKAEPGTRGAWAEVFKDRRNGR